MRPILLLVCLSFIAATYAQNCGCDANDPDYPCCSQYGWCGNTADYCSPDNGCQQNCWGSSSSGGSSSSSSSGSGSSSGGSSSSGGGSSGGGTSGGDPTPPPAGSCFPLGSASFSNGVPNNRSDWWCSADETYGFLGFSYPLEAGCDDWSNSYDAITADMQTMKQKYGATFLRTYLPGCRSTDFYKTLVKAGRDNNMAIVPMLFWDFGQNDGLMYEAENNFLNMLSDPEVGKIAPFVIHSILFNDEVGEEGDYWVQPLKDFKQKLAQFGIPLAITDDWDRTNPAVYKNQNNGDWLNDFGKQINDIEDLTHNHIQPYYHPEAGNARDVWSYIQHEVKFMNDNNLKKPHIISQSCWPSSGGGHAYRGGDVDNMDNFIFYWKLFTDNCQYWKDNRVGWFMHAWSDNGEGPLGLLDGNNNPKFDFNPQKC